MNMQRTYIRTQKKSEVKKMSVGKMARAEKAKKKAKKMNDRDKKAFQGNLMNFWLHGKKPRFHNVDRNRHGHIYEPSDKFRVVITTSKNNCWIVVQNRSRNNRCVFKSYAGNVGIRGNAKGDPNCARRVSANVARKLKALGVNHVEVAFRRTYRVAECLDSLQTNGIVMTALIHRPRLCKGPAPKPRKRRKV